MKSVSYEYKWVRSLKEICISRESYFDSGISEELKTNLKKIIITKSIELITYLV